MRETESRWLRSGVVLAALIVSCGSSDAPVGGAGGGGGSSGGATTSGGSGGTGSSGAAGAAGAPADGGSCSELGMACSGTCGSGFHCTQSVCTPEGRAQCGGFAGTECPGEFPVCLTCSGCDFGVCFTEAERICVCATAAGKTAFPTCVQ